MVSSIVLVFSLLASTDALSRSYSGLVSAASQSQIRFAIENKYDDTGPGAKGPEAAYNTYKTLEEALITYLDDPDTKLPQGERERAVAALRVPPLHTPIRQYPKTVEEYTGYETTERPLQEQFNMPREYYTPLGGVKNYELSNVRNNFLKVNDAPRLHTEQSERSAPAGLLRYKPDPTIQKTYNSFDPNPRYSISYDVHDKLTGDSKSARETRTDGVVRGYYTFRDADGKQRTVRYTADDERGFRASVESSPATDVS